VKKPQSLEDSDLSRLYTATSLMQIDDNVMRWVPRAGEDSYGVGARQGCRPALPNSIPFNVKVFFFSLNTCLVFFCFGFWFFGFCFIFAVLKFELRAYTLSHATSPSLCWVF
jgi:hypothetical protein